MTAPSVRFAEWQQHGQQFAGYFNGKVELFDTSLNVISSHEITSATCMEWHPAESKSHLMALGTQAGSVSLLDWSTNQETMVNKSRGRNRSCMSVSWNKHSTNQLASGFELLKSDHCVVIWDVNAAGSGLVVDDDDRAILTKLCFEEATSSLCWLPQDPHLLAVGTSMGWVRIYDTRVGSTTVSSTAAGAGSSAAEISLMAHPAARPRKVRGIRPDPFNTHLLATFSDSPGEVIKLWDLRKGVAAKSKLTPYFTVIPLGPDSPDGQTSTQGAVSDVCWSLARPNVLAVAMTHQRCISFYSTTKFPPAAITRVPIHSIAVAEPVKSLSWQNEDKTGVSSQVQRASANRLLFAVASGYGDLEIRESLPLSMTSGGRVASALSQSVVLVEPLAMRPDGVSGGAVEHAERNWCQGEQSMSERASAGYSLDAGKNMQVLFDELDSLFVKERSEALIGETPKSVAVASKATALLELSRVWGWVDRVESMHDDDMNLTNCGVLCLFASGQQLDAKNTESFVHEVLGTRIYASECRASARMVCGWTDISNTEDAGPQLRKGKGLDQDQSDGSSEDSADDDDDDDDEDEEDEDEEDDDDDNNDDDKDDEDDDTDLRVLSTLEAIVEECEDLDSFERATAIALWHGNIELAVCVLRRTIDAAVNKRETTSAAAAMDKEKEEVERGRELSADYVQLLSLVAMCLAGYTQPSKRAFSTTPSPSSSSVWAPMCLHVLEQLERSSRHETCYLAAACRFLLDILANTTKPQAQGSFDSIIRNNNIYLEDRIAFACTYLSDKACHEWLNGLCSECKQTGSLEGLLVTGLSGDGQDILQQYVDTFDDIQTVALLVARNVEKLPDKATPSRDWLWLYEYRTLLNRWQMFIERASLDVELGKLQRQRPAVHRSSAVSLGSLDSPHPSSGALSQAVQPQQAGTGATQGTGNKARTGSQHPDRKSSLVRSTFALPLHSDFPHVFLRCHYCSSALPVDAMQQQQQQHTAFLRKQRPVINFCPNCKKPLPRCYVCQLYVGLINPHYEVSRILAQRRRIAESQQSAGGSGAGAGTAIVGTSSSGAQKEDEKAEHNILDFGRWFFFCQRCKHGGHASCINDWFSGEGGHTSRRDTCGVNGCNCLCSVYDYGQPRSSARVTSDEISSFSL